MHITLKEPAHDAHLVRWIAYAMNRTAVIAAFSFYSLAVDLWTIAQGLAVHLVLIAFKVGAFLALPILAPILAYRWRDAARTDHALERMFHDIANAPKS